MLTGIRHTAVLVLGFVLLVLMMACGGTPTPLTPEEALTKRAESFNIEISDENWLETHKYLSPRTREVCKNGEYAVAMGMVIGMLKEFTGMPEDAKLTFSVLRVTVDGDIGHVYEEMKHDGDVIEFGEDEEDVGSDWVYVDGEWWQEEDDWETTCELF